VLDQQCFDYIEVALNSGKALAVFIQVCDESGVGEFVIP
jgi:Flp pilus assembly protein CpaB